MNHLLLADNSEANTHTTSHTSSNDIQPLSSSSTLFVDNKGIEAFGQNSK